MNIETESQQPIVQRRWIALGLGVALLFFAICLGMLFLVQILYLLAIGWVSYLWHTIPNLTFPVSGILWFLCTLPLFFWGVHSAGRALFQRTDYAETASAQTTAESNWRLRSSISLVGMVVVLTTSGIALTGMTHQLWWMTTGGKGALLEKRFGSFVRPVSFREAARPSVSKTNLKMIGLALDNYHDQQDRFPIGATVDSLGKPQHGWVARILPYMDKKDLYRQIDFNQPWTAEVNRKPYETRLPELQSPGMAPDFVGQDVCRADDSGYQPAHYAANSHVLGINSGLRLRDITDGSANTIMGGEVKERIRAWGNPLNLRDPAQGINQGPGGFGSHFKQNGKTGAHILFCDGSVRFVTDDIAPDLLKKLSLPADHQTTCDGW